MAKISPVTGRYVTIEVDDLEYRVFWLENGEGPALVCQHTALQLTMRQTPSAWRQAVP